MLVNFLLTGVLRNDGGSVITNFILQATSQSKLKMQLKFTLKMHLFTPQWTTISKYK